MTTFPDDTLRFVGPTGTCVEFRCIDVGCVWPPPDVVDNEQLVKWGIHPSLVGYGPLVLRSCSTMTDEDRMNTNVFFRGAIYVHEQLLERGE
jgi:hypothetical protein